jgi:hypothetical protein
MEVRQSLFNIKTFMKEIGKMIKQTEKELLLLKMVHNILENLKTITLKERVKEPIQMEINSLAKFFINFKLQVDQR